MNEKIRELFHQAYGYPIDVVGEQAEKFAELIIKECANVAKRTILAGSGVDPDTFTGTVTTVQEINRHFGVDL